MTTTIRPATADDIPALIALGAVMHAESPRFSRFAFERDRLDGNIRMVLAYEYGFAVVAECAGEMVGGLLAVAMPHFACDLLQACDLAYFVRPDRRGGIAAVRLADAYREWAASLGAEASIGLNTGVQPERTAKLLAALGAQQTGTVWTWRET